MDYFLFRKSSIVIAVTLFVCNLGFQVKAGEMNQAWYKYYSGLDLKSYQDHCVPVHLSPPKGIPSVSKIILIHGFTACPQQFFEWSEQLTRSGIEVYLLTLPGEGLLNHSNGKDKFEALPSHGFIKPYQQLAKVVVDIANSDSLPSSVGGVSVGAAVALHAALINTHPFEKVLLMTPFLEISNDWARNLLPPLNFIPKARDYKWGWDEEACSDEIKRGRAGICNFTVSQVATIQDYGQSIENLAKKEVNKNYISNSKVQIIGVENDPAAGNSAIHRILSLLGYPTKINQIRICFYSEDVNHSLMSRFDSPDQTKYWLDGLLKNSTLFQTEGQWIPTHGFSKIEKGIPNCQ